MLTISIVFGAIMCQMFLLLGGVIGYLTYHHLSIEAEAIVPSHPEFFDGDGNMINEELLTIRFESSFDHFDEWEDDE